MKTQKMQHKDWKIMYDRERLATSAFWGGNEKLADLIRTKNSYEMDGCTYQANSLSQQDYIDTTMKMSEIELQEVTP